MSGYPMIDALNAEETTPVPETMSPRERVAAVLDPEIWADDMPVPTRAAVTDFHARRQASVIKADAILAALASSGDHAELARLAEAVAAPMSTKTMGMHLAATENFQRAANPAAVLALIAENAALRERLEWIWREADQNALNGVRLVEAERKLAEAVGHASWMRNFVPTVWGSTEERLDGIDAFLSKEAERG